MKLLENGNCGSFSDIEMAADELLHEQEHPLFNEANAIMKHLES